MREGWLLLGGHTLSWGFMSDISCMGQSCEPESAWDGVQGTVPSGVYYTLSRVLLPPPPPSLPRVQSADEARLIAVPPLHPSGAVS